MNPNTTRRESDEGYCAVVARLDSRWRVIVCRDAIQWILQCKDSALTARRDAWRGRRYHRTRDGLKRSVRHLVSNVLPDGAASIAALPARIEDSRPFHALSSSAKLEVPELATSAGKAGHQ